MTVPPEILAELEALRAAFRESAVGMVDDLAAGWSEATRDPSVARLRDLTRQAHSLAGTAGSFALMSLSTRARELEHRLEALSATGEPTGETFGAVEPLLRALQAEARPLAA